MGRTTGSDAVLARLEALTARLDEQAAEIAQLKATAAMPIRSPMTAAAVAEPKVGRRGLLTRVLRATAAAAVLTVAREAATAHAYARGTVVGSTTSRYGLLAAPESFEPLDPATSIPDLGNTVHGVIGSNGPSAMFAPPPSDGAGVTGFSNLNRGVQGYSGSGIGVYGISGFTGVRGTSLGSSGQNYGVWGFSGSGIGTVGSADNGVGVNGTSTNGIGVQGFSTAQIGVRGDSTNNYAVYGRSSLTALRGEATGSGVGFVGIAGQGPGSKAGQFVGAVLVQGSFTVSGGAKSAAVPHPDGTHRRVYCQESTEAWFEDFGTATLTNGRAVVDLDPDFDAVVKGDDYLVFMTAEGDCNGLYISRKGPHRFVVEEIGNGKSTVPFSYRVVSRRRENVGARLEKVDVKEPPTPKSPPQRVGPDGRLMDATPVITTQQSAQDI